MDFIFSSHNFSSWNIFLTFNDILPYQMNGFFVIKFIKYTITTNHNEIIFALFSNFEGSNIRFCYDYIWISFKSSQFSFDITECTTNWKSARKDTMRSINYLRLTLKCWVRMWYDRTILVNTPTILNYSFCFYFISWFVIIWKSVNFLAIFSRHYSSTVSNISNITNVINDYYYNGARSRSINLSNIISLFFSKL